MTNIQQYHSLPTIIPSRICAVFAYSLVINNKCVLCWWSTIGGLLYHALRFNNSEMLSDGGCLLECYVGVRNIWNIVLVLLIAHRSVIGWMSIILCTRISYTNFVYGSFDEYLDASVCVNFVLWTRLEFPNVWTREC